VIRQAQVKAVGSRNYWLGHHCASDAREENIAAVRSQASQSAKALLQLLDGEHDLFGLFAVLIIYRLIAHRVRLIFFHVGPACCPSHAQNVFHLDFAVVYATLKLTEEVKYVLEE